MKTLSEHNFSFDCASIKEIRTIQRQKSPKSPKSIYANPIKSSESIAEAKTLGINLYTLDCLDELQKISKWHSNCGYLLRIAVDDKYSLCKLNGKFGMRNQALAVFFQNYQNYPAQFKGIAFHVGSNCMSPQSYIDALALVDSVIKPLKHSNLCLDIGGGFTKSTKLSDISDIVIKYSNDKVTKLIAEPGRIIVEDIMDLYVPVIGVNTASNSVYINNSIYSDFNCITYDHKVLSFSILRGSREYILSDSKWIIKGSPNGIINNCIQQNIYGATCDSLDKILVTNCPKLQVGDILKFHEMGAYTYSSRAEFNGIPLAKVIIE